jgi:Golgi phosphoprotein 3 GPP34/MgtE-like protein
MDVSPLAASGATAIISAMASDAWTWVKTEVARRLARNDDACAREETSRLEAFAGELSTATERDVKNRLHGYLEARLGEDAVLQNDFLALIREISVKIGVPASQTLNHVTATNSTIVQASGGSVQLNVNLPQPVIRWMAMPAAEAARMLEEMELPEALNAITAMEPVLAARRLAHIGPQRVQQLLMGMAEESAAAMLSMLPDPHQAGTLLSGLELDKAAAILDLTAADWTVARLAEMDAERAAVLLGAMGSKRRDDLIAAMQSQDAVGLLGALTKVVSDQARARNTLEYLQRKAEQIRANAEAEAEAILEAARERARIEAAGIASYGAVLNGGALNGGALNGAALNGIPLHGGAVPGDVAETLAEGLLTPGRAAARRPRHALDDDSSLAPAGMVLAFDYFLISHDSAGHAHIEQTNLESGLAAAVLIELVRAGRVEIDSGGPVVVRGADAEDETLVESALRSIGTERRQSIPTWISGVRTELFLHMAQHVVDTGVVVPVKRMMSGLLYKRVKESVAGEPAARVMRNLLNATHPPDEPTYLLIALIDVVQLHSKLPVPLRTRKIRELVRQVLAGRTQPPYLSVILGALDAAIAINTTGPKRR